MKLKRLFSVLSVFAVSATSVLGSFSAAVPAVHADETTEPAVQSDMEISGNGLLGEMLADKLTAEQTALNEQNGCSVYDVQIQGKRATVKLTTTTACTVLLTLYDDSGDKLLTSAQKAVSADDSDIILTVPDMPEYCYLRCCLIDTDTLSPISSVYSSSLYTKEMQEFLSKTTDDFDANRVMNLDDDKTQNFMVLGENVVYVESSDTINTAELDQENSTVTLRNYDENTALLKEGNTVCLDMGDNSTIFRVGKVDISDESIVIKAEKAELEDLFDYINIGSLAHGFTHSADAPVGEDGSVGTWLDEPAKPQPEPAPPKHMPAEYLPDSFEFAAEANIPFSIPFGDQSLTADNYSHDTAIKGVADFNLHPSMSFYLSKEHSYVNFDLGVDVNLHDLLLYLHGSYEYTLATFSLTWGPMLSDAGELNMEQEWSDVVDGSFGEKSEGRKIWDAIFKEPTLQQQAELISVSNKIKLVLEGGCSVEGSATIGMSTGFQCDTGSGLRTYTSLKKPSFEIDGIEANVFIGLSYELSTTLLSLDLPMFVDMWTGKTTLDSLNATISTPTGIRFTAKSSRCVSKNTSFSKSLLDTLGYASTLPRKDIHDCEWCIGGEVFFESSTKVSLSSDIFSELNQENTPSSCSKKLADWHYCKDRNEFAMTLCPHHYQAIAFLVTDDDNKPVKDVEVLCSTADAAYENNNKVYTDEHGEAVLYLNSGLHTVYLDDSIHDYVKIPVNVTDSGKAINVNMTKGSSSSTRKTGKNEYWGEPDENGIVIADGVKYYLFREYAEVESYTSDIKPDTVLYSKVNGLPVTRIDYHAFEDCKNLNSITIPDSVTEIADRAFNRCQNLTSVNIPNSVTKINKGVFGDCRSLTNISIPNSITSIGMSAFLSCENLTSVIIPNSVTEIGESAFGDCYSLTNITIPDSVRNIGQRALGDCKSLTSIIIPDSVSSISEGLFQECKSLQSITIPESVTSIGDWAFNMCENLQSITIPDNVTSIGDYAFDHCSSLTSITLPKNVTEIGDGMFRNCTNLVDITIPKNVTEIGNAAFKGTPWFNNRKQENPLVIVNDILIDGKISESEVMIPNNVSRIGHYAFGDCYYMTSVYIPESVTSIGVNAFCHCYKFTDIYFAGTEEQWNAINIDDYNEELNSITIHYSSSHAENTTSKASFHAAKVQNDIAVTAVTETTAPSAETAITTANTSRDETDLTSLTPNTVYNIYALADREKGLETGNLLYFAQAVSDENGAVNVQYEGDVFAVRAMHNLENAECTVPEFIYDGTEHEIFPTVTANGKALEEGVDYLVSGSYSETEPGLYTIQLEGAGDWFGTKTLTYMIEPKRIIGDLNDDGEINLKDVVLLRRYIAGGWNVTLDESVADINGDETVNLKDVVLLRRYIAGGWNVELNPTNNT